MEILIGADVVPRESNLDLFNVGDVKAILGPKLLNIWNSADARIFNLETPITDEFNPIEKLGPVFSAPLSTIKGIKALNPTLISGANNHILDHGMPGIKDTIKILNKHCLSYVGFGENIQEASKPHILSINGLKIGVYACAEHEFSIASKSKPGANPFDPLESLDYIQELKEKCDYVIVLYHGGKELYRYPSPYLQKVTRKIVEKGADLVICQHSHCVGSFEKYKDSTIIYGQGNFLFDGPDNDYWNNGMLIRMTFYDSVEIDYVPFVKSDNTIRLADEEESKEILSGFYERSREILDEGKIVKNYSEFAGKKIDSYLRTISGTGKWKSRLDKWLLNDRLLKRQFTSKELLAVQNYVECEAHKELISVGLKTKRGNYSDSAYK